MSPTQLKAWVKNTSKSIGIPADLVMRNYMMGKLLEKIADSPYSQNFVVKGGFLLGSMLGIENRATMDLDTTLRKMSGEKEKLLSVLEEIIQDPTPEGIVFKIKGDIQETREAANYPGFRVHLIAQLENMPIDLKMDITTGDTIYPAPLDLKHKLMFENKAVDMLAYPPEQILAEKIHAALYLEETNTRARDFYDIYALTEMNLIDPIVLADAMEQTFSSRGMHDSLESYIDDFWPVIRDSPRLKATWNRYMNASTNPYAKNLPFEEVMKAGTTLLNQVKEAEREKNREEEMGLDD
jgi:Domain of unknown function (DUF1814).